MKNRICSSLFLVVLVFVVAIGVFGCAQQGTEVANVQAQSYFPHEDGYSWEYHSSWIFDGTREAYSDTKTRYFDGTTTLANGLVVQNFMVSGEAITLPATAADTLKAFAILEGSLCYYISETGVYTYGSVKNPTTEAELIIPLPLKVGDFWAGSYAIYEVICTEEVTVPAGTFSAIKIGMTFLDTNEPNAFDWYAPGVGLVKSYILIPVISEIGNELEMAIWTQELV